VLVKQQCGDGSRGTIRLASADPLAPPLTDPGFLRDGQDFQRLVAGVDLIRSAAARTSLPGTEIHPGITTRGTGLGSYIRRAAGSYWHPAGTCRMGGGTRPWWMWTCGSRGIDGPRVADASVMPVIPNAPLNATVLAIAEKAAHLISRTGPVPPGRDDVTRGSGPARDDGRRPA
jgi:choline dehydrogenase